MAMRETVRSLSIYFVIVGIYSCCLHLQAFSEYLLPLQSTLTLLSAIASLALVLCGLRLRKLLATRPALPRQVVLFFIPLDFIQLLSKTLVLQAVSIGSAISLALSLYLLVQLRRLTDEVQQGTEVLRASPLR
jgi:hypothetical protein